MREIDEILNIEPVDNPTGNAMVRKANQSLQQVKESYALTVSNDPRFNEDFEEVRDNLKDIILEVNDNIKKLSMIAQENEKASSFSALAQLVTTLLNANKQLLEIYDAKKKYYEVDHKANGEVGDIHVQNAIFTGTTADLKAYIQSMKDQS